MATKLSWKFITLAAAFPILLGGGLFALSHFDIVDFGLVGDDHSEHDHPAAEKAELYTCPMHPEVVQEGPGTCPICKMDLVPMKGTRATGGEVGPLNGFDGMPPVGTKAFCPVMRNEFTVHEKTASSEYLGKTYVYCCPGCKPLFDQDPEMYIEVLREREAGEIPAPEPATAAGERPLETGGSGKDVVIDPVVVQNMGVRVAEVEHGPIFRHVRTVGEVLVAEDHVSVVNLRFGGWIERIFVDETGQEVKRGAPLFSVFSPELVAAQEEYLLAVRSGGPDSWLARSAARRLELWGISKGLLKRIVKQDKSLRAITITAPRSGYVLHKNVLQGAHVNAGADLYRIGDLDRIWVNAEVYEHDAAWVNVGQPATMELSFQQGKTWEGSVSYVYPTLNPKTRTLTVRLEFENPGVNLKPGMLATVRIETQRKDHVVTVPAEAVLHSGERRLVFVARGYGRYEPREIEIGLTGDNRRIEVLSGLVKGERVVTSGQFLLDSESQLQEAVQKLLEARLQAKSKGERS